MDLSPVTSLFQPDQQFFNSPNTLLAVLVAAAFFLLRGRRTTLAVYASSLLAGAGFLVSVWVGLAAIAVAVGLRVGFATRSAVGGVVAFVVSVVAVGLSVNALAPGVGVPVSIERLAATIDKVNGLGPVILLALLAVLLVLLVVRHLRQYRGRNPYRSQGVGSEDILMRPNPDLVVLPEEQRDPTRFFPKAWKYEKLREQGLRCAYFDVGCPVQAAPGVLFHGDHVISHSRGGRTCYANLQVLCADCNSAKSDKLDEEVRRQRRALFAA